MSDDQLNQHLYRLRARDRVASLLTDELPNLNANYIAELAAKVLDEVGAVEYGREAHKVS